jgi:hypothetical protein
MQTQVADTSPTLVFTEILQASLIGGTTQYAFGARMVSLSLTPTPTMTHWSGALASNISGCMSSFDGQRTFLSCFPHAPRAPTGADTGSGTSHTSGEVYLYCCIFEDQDNLGNVIRSTPSALLTYTQPANAHDCTLTVFPTRMADFARPVATRTGQWTTIGIYKTGPGGTVLYKIGSVQMDSTQASQTFVDGVTDALTIQGTPLYTTGGALENTPGPHTRSLVGALGRIWAVSCDSLEIYFTKKLIPGEFPSWNDSLVLRLDKEGGNPLTIVEMDSKMILFRRSAIQVIYGDGPDETGAGSFQGPNLINSEFGIINERGIVLTDDGVMFSSDRGIWLLSRGLQAQYIGAGVDDFKTNTVVGAHNLQDRDQTWFWTAEGNTLVYDSYHRIWSVFSTLVAKDSKIIDRVPHYLTANGLTVYKENKTSYADGAAGAIELKMVTGWLSFAGLQGYQRVRRLSFIGNYFAAHTATLKVYYDMDTTAFETISISSATIKPVGDNLYQYQVRLKRQKCEAIRIELSLSDTTQAFSLSGMAFEVGIKPKSNRLPVYKRVSS